MRVMKYIFAIHGQMIAHLPLPVVPLGIGAHGVVPVSFKEKEQKGVLMRILVGLTNVVRLVRKMEVVDSAIRGLRL